MDPLAVRTSEVELRAVDGRKGDQSGFGSSFQASLRLLWARRDEAIRDTLSRRLKATPGHVAVAQNDLVEALPLRLLFPMLAAHEALEPVPPAADAPTSIRPQGAVSGQHLLVDDPAVASVHALALRGATGRADTQKAMEQERAVAKCVGAAVRTASARATDDVAPTAKAIAVERLRMKAAAVQEELTESEHKGMAGVAAVDRAAATLAARELRRLANEQWRLQEYGIDGLKPRSSRSPEHDDGLSDASMFVGTDPSSRLVSHQAATAAKLLRSCAFTRVAGLASHFCFWRVLRPMAVLLRDEHDHGEEPGQTLSDDDDAALLSLLIRAWRVLEDTIERASTAGREGKLRSVALLGVKVCVDSLLRGQFVAWSTYERSASAFHAKFAKQEDETGRWQPVVVPLHGQIDALLSSLFDSGRAASFIPRLSLSTEALDRITKSRRRVAAAGSAATASGPPSRHTVGGHSPVLPSLEPESESTVPPKWRLPAAPPTQRNVRRAAPMSSRGSTQSATAGPAVVTAVHGLPFPTRAAELQHMTSGVLHATIPTVSISAVARGLVARGGMAGAAPVAAGRPKTAQTPSATADTLVGTARRITRRYARENSQRDGRLSQLREATKFLKSLSLPSADVSVENVFRRAIVEAARAFEGQGDVAPKGSYAALLRAAVKTAGETLASGTDADESLSPREELLRSADILAMGAGKTANELVAEIRTKEAPKVRKIAVAAAVALAAGGLASTESPQAWGRRRPEAQRSGPPPWASPFRKLDHVIGASWAAEHEQSLSTLFKQSEAWVILNRRSLSRDSSGSPPSQASSAWSSPRRRSSRLGSPGRRPGSSASERRCTAPERELQAATVGPVGEHGLPIEAEKITGLLAARSPFFPSPFDGDGVSAFGPTQWARGPGARAAAERADAARAEAVAKTFRDTVKSRAAAHRGKLEVEELHRRARQPEQPGDSGLVRLIRRHVEADAEAETRHSGPGAAPAMPLVGLPQKWLLGLADPSNPNQLSTL